MGYILLGLLLIVLVVMLVAALSRSRPRGNLQTPDHAPVSRAAPASDEVTPDASDTAPPRQVEQAKRRTPPA